MAAKKTSKNNQQPTAKGKAKKITAPLYSKSGNKSGTMALPAQLFGQKPNPRLLSQYVRVFLANQRRARAKTKTRGEVKISKQKIYRQKGTGGARHGARSAPIFVGGGIAHGPRGLANYKGRLSRQMRKRALLLALSAKARADEILVGDLEKIEPKTKNLARFLAKIQTSGAVTLAHAGSQTLLQAGANLTDVRLTPAATLSAYDVLVAPKLILTREAVAILAARLGDKNEPK